MRVHRIGFRGRVFFIDDSDSVRSIPFALYERLIKGASSECLPEYAGKRVRCAVVWVEIAKRKPWRISDVDYILLPFNSKGRIDLSEWERKKKVGMELTAAKINHFLSSMLRKKRKSNLIDAQHRFLKRRYDHEFKWKPNRRIEEAIATGVLGKSQF